MKTLTRDGMNGGTVDEANSGEEYEIIIVDGEKFGLKFTDSELATRGCGCSRHYVVRYCFQSEAVVIY